jgi:hypothetical protein
LSSGCAGIIVFGPCASTLVRRLSIVNRRLRCAFARIADDCGTLL